MKDDTKNFKPFLTYWMFYPEFVNFYIKFVINQLKNPRLTNFKEIRLNFNY